MRKVYPKGDVGDIGGVLLFEHPRRYTQRVSPTLDPANTTCFVLFEKTRKVRKKSSVCDLSC